MNNNEIKNSTVEVPSSQAMNDLDYITAQLTCEKNISVNLIYSLNETSNETFYNVLYLLFKETKDMQRKIYELRFQKG